MTEEQFDQEFPHGSQKRQEELSRLEHADAKAPDAPAEPESQQLKDFPETVDSGRIPEASWRGNAV